MANRRGSTWQQLATIAALSGLWLLVRAVRRKNPDTCSDQKSRYCLNVQHYAAYTILLLLADLYAIPAVLRGKLLISAEEIAELNPDLVPWHDRVALGYVGERHEHYRKISDHVLKAFVALPFLLLVNKRIRRDWATVVTLYSWLHAVTYTIYSFSPLGPAFVDKYRPVVFYNLLPEAVRNLGNNRNARFSGHTANATCAAFFLAKVYNDYHPNQSVYSKYGHYLLSYMAPLLVGWLRTKALKHFPSDVLHAIAVGGVCGIMVPELYKRES
jgi:hypothetical protein